MIIFYQVLTIFDDDEMTFRLMCIEYRVVYDGVVQLIHRYVDSEYCHTNLYVYFHH